MATNNFVGHSGSDGSDIADRAAREGYAFVGGWQIVAAGQITAVEAVTAWMSSGVHRAIVLDCSLRDGGAGYAFDSTDSLPYRHYWTADFGRR